MAKRKREVFIRIISGMIGVVVGIAMTVAVISYKSNKTEKQPVLQNAVLEQFNDEDFWEKINSYYEQERKTFFESYLSIYNDYSIYLYLDREIEPYFEKYGYNAVLYSGLTSGNKLAEVFCIDKCCELVGREDLDTKALSEALERLVIDETLHEADDLFYDEGEKFYIEKAKERKKLAIALLNNNMMADVIVKNEDKTRCAWISDAFYETKSIRVWEDGFFYEFDNPCFCQTDSLQFLSPECLYVCGSFDSQLVVFDKNIQIVEILESINTYLNGLPGRGNKLKITQIDCKDNIVSAAATMICYADDLWEEKCKFDFDIDKMKITSFEYLE